MKYELVLIDLDDTLFDYSKTEDSAFRKTFEKMGFFEVSEIKREKMEENYEKIKKRYKEINLQLWKDLENGKIDKDRLRVLRFERIIEEFGLGYDSIGMSELYLKKLGEGVFPFEMAEKLCEYLHSKYKVGVVTNGIKEVQHSRIENSEIAKYIDKLVLSLKLAYYCHFSLRSLPLSYFIIVSKLPSSLYFFQTPSFLQALYFPSSETFPLLQ